MKLTRKTIVNAQGPLGRLGAEKFKGANAGKITYNIARNIGVTAPIVEAYSKAQNALIEKYRRKKKAVKEGEEDVWVIPDENQRAFQEESEALLAEEEEINNVFLVTLPAPTEENPLQINGLDRYLLDWMIKVEGEE